MCHTVLLANMCAIVSPGFSRAKNTKNSAIESRVEMIKWSFLFWTGQCFVILGFLLVFLRNR
jgi:hypothetical protein